jgi:hypothetical protein
LALTVCSGKVKIQNLLLKKVKKLLKFLLTTSISTILAPYNDVYLYSILKGVCHEIFRVLFLACMDRCRSV